MPGPTKLPVHGRLQWVAAERGSNHEPLGRLVLFSFLLFPNRRNYGPLARAFLHHPYAAKLGQSGTVAGHGMGQTPGYIL